MYNFKVVSTVNKTKRQPMEWEKIFTIDTTGKGLISKIYKELLKLNTHKTDNHVKKWEEHMNRHFSNEDMFIITNHHGDLNQNHIEIPPYTS